MKKFRFLILLFLLLLLSTFTGCGVNKNALVVDDMIASIGSVTLDSEDAIAGAELAYDTLSRWEKIHVKNYPMLLEAREIFNRIKDVTDLFQALDPVTLNSEADIIEAKSAYEALSPEEQRSIPNYDLLVDAQDCYESLVRIDVVEKAIEATKNIDVERIKSEGDITLYIKAKELYNDLNQDEKSEVQNYNILEEMETKIPIGWMIPVLSEKEYWEFIDSKLREILHEHDLYIMKIDSGIPYYSYYVEPGRLTDDNTYRPIGLERDDYETLFEEIKEALHQLLNQYSIDYGKGIFSRPIRDIIGLHFYNRFNHSVFGKGACLGVADYQVDLLSYYYHHWSDKYTVMNNFNDFYWAVSEVYTPQIR